MLSGLQILSNANRYKWLNVPKRYFYHLSFQPRLTYIAVLLSYYCYYTDYYYGYIINHLIFCHFRLQIATIA